MFLRATTLGILAAALVLLVEGNHAHARTPNVIHVQESGYWGVSKWTLTKRFDGTYKAQEHNFGRAVGIATLQSGVVSLIWTTPDRQFNGIRKWSLNSRTGTFINTKFPQGRSFQRSGYTKISFSSPDIPSRVILIETLWARRINHPIRGTVWSRVRQTGYRYVYPNGSNRTTGVQGAGDPGMRAQGYTMVDYRVTTVR